MPQQSSQGKRVPRRRNRFGFFETTNAAPNAKLSNPNSAIISPKRPFGGTGLPKANQQRIKRAKPPDSVHNASHSPVSETDTNNDHHGDAGSRRVRAEPQSWSDSNRSPPYGSRLSESDCAHTRIPTLASKGGAKTTAQPKQYAERERNLPQVSTAAGGLIEDEIRHLYTFSRSRSAPFAAEIKSETADMQSPLTRRFQSITFDDDSGHEDKIPPVVSTFDGRDQTPQLLRDLRRMDGSICIEEELQHQCPGSPSRPSSHSWGRIGVPGVEAQSASPVLQQAQRAPSMVRQADMQVRQKTKQQQLVSSHPPKVRTPRRHDPLAVYANSRAPSRIAQPKRGPHSDLAARRRKLFTKHPGLNNSSPDQQSSAKADVNPRLDQMSPGRWELLAESDGCDTIDPDDDGTESYHHRKQTTAVIDRGQRPPWRRFKTPPGRIMPKNRLTPVRIANFDMALERVQERRRSGFQRRAKIFQQDITVRGVSEDRLELFWTTVAGLVTAKKLFKAKYHDRNKVVRVVNGRLDQPDRFSEEEGGLVMEELQHQRMFAMAGVHKIRVFLTPDAQATLGS